MKYQENQLVMDNDGDCMLLLVKRLPNGYWKTGGLDDELVILHEGDFRGLTKEEREETNEQYDVLDVVHGLTHSVGFNWWPI